MQVSRSIFGCLALSALFSSAHALEAPPSTDIHCLIVGSLWSNSADTTQRAAGSILVMYYVGRLESFSAQEIEDAMVSEAFAMPPPMYQSEAMRCGKTLQEKGQMMQQIGQNLYRRGKEMGQKNASRTAPPETKLGAQ
jgi:hypothetical protein